MDNQTDVPVSEQESNDSETYVLIWRYINAIDSYYEDDDGHEFHTLKGDWKIETEEVKGIVALHKRIDEIYDSQADNPPYDNAYPIVAYESKSKTIVWSEAK